jgi:hypothetical protein
MKTIRNLLDDQSLTVGDVIRESIAGVALVGVFVGMMFLMWGSV